MDVGLKEKLWSAVIKTYDYGDLPDDIKYVYAPCINAILVNPQYPELLDWTPQKIFCSTKVCMIGPKE